MKKIILLLILHVFHACAYPNNEEMITCFCNCILEHITVSPFILKEVTRERLESLIYTQKELNPRNVMMLEDGYHIVFFENTKNSRPRFLAKAALNIIPPRPVFASEPEWLMNLDDKPLKWLVLASLKDHGELSENDFFYIVIPTPKCGIFQIKNDPLDNRLGVDLELLYEDLQLIISHRPDWASVSAGQLKTDFAKAVLARLLEQSAQPDQGNSEHSEVGRQAAE